MTILSMVLGCGFSDFEKAESKKIVGNIYVINLNIPEDSGFYIILRKNPKYDKYLFEDYEYVDYIEGNDSLLLIKTRIDFNTKYHLIEHSKGDTIFQIKDLSETEFLNVEKFLFKKYFFNSKLP